MNRLLVRLSPRVTLFLRSMLGPIGVDHAIPCLLTFILSTGQMVEVAANLKTSPMFPSGSLPPPDGVMMPQLTEEPILVPQPIQLLYMAMHQPPIQLIIQAVEM